MPDDSLAVELLKLYFKDIDKFFLNLFFVKYLSSSILIWPRKSSDFSFFLCIISRYYKMADILAQRFSRLCWYNSSCRWMEHLFLAPVRKMFCPLCLPVSKQNNSKIQTRTFDIEKIIHKTSFSFK